MAVDGLEEMVIIVFGSIFTEKLWRKKEKGLDEVVLFLVFCITSFNVTIYRVHVFFDPKYSTCWKFMT